MKSSFCIDLQRFMLIPTKFPLSRSLGSSDKHRVFILVYVLYAKELSSESGVYQSKDKS